MQNELSPAKPLKLRNLALIKWKDPEGQTHRFDLASKVSSKWRDFGRRVDLDEGVMDGWQRELQGDTNQLWERVMDTWLKGQGQEEYECNWEGLFEMLEDVKMLGIVSDLKHALCEASAQK